MSLYDDASLIMYPSGYKADKIYSLKPTDGSGDFDFARASSATRVNAEGLIETVATGVPRIDYTGSGCGKLLLEPQRTNLVTYSSEFDNAAWITFRSSVTANATTSPDGTQNAEKIIQQLSTTDSGGVYQDLSLSNSTVYTYSVYLKEAGYDFGLVRVDGTQYAWFDLATGVVGSITGSGSSSIQNMGNGWYRCIFTFTTTSTLGQLHIYVAQTNGSSIVSSADGVKGIFAYGAQLESATYPTSYIPTAGSQVTRVAETANGAGDASTFNSSEGVLMAETKGENDGTFNYISLSDGGTTNYAGILYTDNDNQITYRYYVGGNGVQIVIQNIIVTNFNKIAIKYKANDFAIWINGIEVGTASSGSLNPIGTFNQLAFARGGANNTPFYGSAKQLQYFPSALNDSELETLTSWTSFNEMAQAQNYNII